ncbi:MAG: hypothetical protein ACLPN1_08570, partial [Dissulfurispiraceae bacterium]
VTNPYTVTGLADGTPYYFIVTAVNNSGESPASNTITATPGPAPAVSIVPTSLDIDLPENWPRTFNITNTGPGNSTLNYRVADDGALGGFLNVQNATGALTGGQFSTINVSVLPQFASDAMLFGATLVLDVYTPGATNYTKFPVAANLINPAINIQSQSCNLLSGPDSNGNYQYSVELSGTAQGATSDQIWISDHMVDGPISFTCAQWTEGDGVGSCTRISGNPVLTQWNLQSTFSINTVLTYTTVGLVMSSGVHGPPNELVTASPNVPCQ